ncbi:MAG: DoxX family protein [Patescibacteria group bacterium]
MAIAFLIGRIIFGLYWLDNARNHLMNSDKLVGYASFKKVPAPKLAIIGSGILLLIGGLSMILGIWPYVGLVALLLFLVPVTFTMHAFWKETDPTARMNDRIQFGKNAALAGAILMMFAISLPWEYSLFN